MVFRYKTDFNKKSEKESVPPEDDTQCCVINLVDDWNLVTNREDSYKINSKLYDVNDLSQDSWDDSIHASGYDFNQTYRNDSTTYGSSTPPTDEYQSDDNTLSFGDKDVDVIPGFAQEISHLNVVDKLVGDLITNVSVLGLYMYYLEDSDIDSSTLTDFKLKLEDTGRIVERIGAGIRFLVQSSGKGRRVLPQNLVTRLKQNLSLYNNILTQYQNYVTSSFSSDASTLYPNRTVEQVRDLLYEFGESDLGDPQKLGYKTGDREAVIRYLKERARDIEYLEESASKLSRVYEELFDVLSKRGEQLSSLEQQILISSGCIDRGKMDIEKAYKYKKSGWRRLAYFASLIVLTCLLLSLPNIIPYIMPYFFDNTKP